MSQEATISASVLLGFEGELASRGLDAQGLCRDCDIPAQVWHDREREIPLSGFVDFLQRGADMSGDPGLGWEAGRVFDLRTLGELGEAVLAAPNLGTALLTFSDYLRLVQSTTELRLDIEDDEALLTYRILDPDIWPRQQDAEFTLSIFLTIIQGCTGADWRPEAIGFEHAPTRPEQAWNDGFATCCRFGQAGNSIALPVAILDCPMPSGDSLLWQDRARALNDAMLRRNRTRPMAGRVTNAVLAALGRGPFGQNDIASRVGLSPRSLHRRLAAEGTRYALILQDCRCRLARHRLACSAQPLSQIALELGYSDQSAFARAFKQSCGTTPGEYRQRHRAVQ